MIKTFIGSAAVVSLLVLLIFISRALDSDTDQTIVEEQTQNETSVQESEVEKIHQNLQSADLSGKGLTQVPKEIFTMTELQQLNLSNNQLSGALPAEIRQLQNLLSLNLSNNQFTGVPAEVGQLKNLQILDLSNNDLTGLPHELGNLGNLQVLDLRGNEYSEQDLEIIKNDLSSSVLIKVD